MGKSILFILGIAFCIFLTACEFLTPDTSSALSGTRQIEELQKQSRQLERQTEALDRLSNSIEKLTDRKIPDERK